MAQKTHIILDSPIGPLTLVNTDGVLSGLYMELHKYGPAKEGIGERVRSGFDLAESQLREYFEHRRTVFAIPLHLEGTDFQRAVWQELCNIPFGKTCTYTDLAVQVGNPKAVRAVGSANGRNPISIVVPCHRVVGRYGSLTGYGGGLDRKKFLLEHENASIVSPPAPLLTR